MNKSKKVFLYISAYFALMAVICYLHILQNSFPNIITAGFVTILACIPIAAEASKLHYRVIDFLQFINKNLLFYIIFFACFLFVRENLTAFNHYIYFLWWTIRLPETVTSICITFYIEQLFCCLTALFFWLCCFTYLLLLFRGKKNISSQIAAI